MSKKSLYLVDISSFIFRAYYAVRPLHAPDGTPVNAVYGVVTMLNKLIESRKPDHLVVCGDRPEKNFRYDIFPEYKANRSAPPEDLVPQFALIREYIEKWPIRIIDKIGYEADDIIATLVHKYKDDPEMEVFIVSQDKDLMQLIAPHVAMFDSMNDRIMREPEVLAKFGVTPDKVVDVQSLCGDPTDNIPGISGIGPKTAAKLVNDCGGLEKILELPPNITGKIREKIEAGKEAALLSRKLVSLDDHVPLDVDWRGLEMSVKNNENLDSFYKKLGFNSLIKNSIESPSSPAQPLAATFHTVSTIDELVRLVSEWQKSPYLAFDTETDSIDSHRANLVGVSLCTDSKNAYYIPLGHVNGENLDVARVLEILAPLMAALTPVKIAQNAKFDMNVLARAGIKNIELGEDTLIASYLSDPEAQHNLDVLAKRHLNHTTIKFDDVVPKGKTFADISIADATRYSAEDAWVAFMLRESLLQKLEHAGLTKVYREIEVPLVGVLAAMEQKGVLIDEKLLRALKVEFSGRMDIIQQEIYQLAGEPFNINSTKQLGEILFNKLKLPTQKKGKTGYSTDVSVLTSLARVHALPQKILDYRTLAKLTSTYVEGLLELCHSETGRIHTTYNQAIVATGRLSSTDPNLQNIPIKSDEGKRIREVFIAPAGCQILSADYSQIELRLLAAFSQDPGLVSAYKNNEDIHARTAAQIFSLSPQDVTGRERSIAKTVNFGVIYGQSPFGLAQQLEVSNTEAKHFIDGFYAAFPKVREYREEVLEKARQEGFVSTFMGRRRYLPDLASSNQLKRQMAERAAFNALFQGSAADLIKCAMLKIDELFRSENLKSRMIMQVHDELVFEVPDCEKDGLIEKIDTCMTQGYPIDIPLVIGSGWGESWAKAHG